MSKDKMQNEIHWYCDKCSDYLNYQKEFNTSSGEWICVKCGGINDVSSHNVDWTCNDCDASLNDQVGFNAEQDEWVCKKCGCLNNLSQDFPCEVCGDMMNEQDGFFGKVNEWQCKKCGTVYGPEEDYGISENISNNHSVSKTDYSFHVGPINEKDLTGTSLELIRGGTSYLADIILADAELIAKESREIYNHKIKPHLVKLDYIQRKLSKDNLNLDEEKDFLIKLDVIAMEIKEIATEYEIKQKKSFFKRIFGFGIKITGQVTSVVLPYLIEQQKRNRND